MPDKLHKYKCRDCGAEYQRHQEQRNGRCPNCAMKAMGEVVRQLHAHEGKYYEIWKARMKAAARRL